MSVDELFCAPENASQARYTRALLNFEKNFDSCRYSTLHRAYWALCIPFILAYLIAIFAGQRYMKSRSPFQLRGALLAWNVAIATFSIVAAWRMLTATFYNVRNYGFLASVCDFDPLEQRQAVAIWIFLFTVSKIVEFGDTAFIVLRKSPLIFLHWYHHLTAALSTAFSGVYASPIHVYFATFNFTVHSIMYSYYALKILKVPVPKPIRMCITSLQMFQMVAGMLVTGYAYFAKRMYPQCKVTDEVIIIAVTVYISYLALFVNFFVKSYLRKMAKQGQRDVHIMKKQS